jgi:hypothetical protein
VAQTAWEALSEVGLGATPPNGDRDCVVGVEEIEPGVVFLMLDPVELRKDNRVTYTQDPPVTRCGPFLCVAAVGDSSLWAPLTFKYRQERLQLERDWLRDGSRRWRSRPQFLSDGASLWLGPKDAFAAASRLEVIYEDGRPHVTPIGLAAVHRKIEAALRHDPTSAAPGHPIRIRHDAVMLVPKILAMIPGVSLMRRPTPPSWR